MIQKYCRLIRLVLEVMRGKFKYSFEEGCRRQPLSLDLDNPRKNIILLLTTWLVRRQIEEVKMYKHGTICNKKIPSIHINQNGSRFHNAGILLGFKSENQQ